MILTPRQYQQAYGDIQILDSGLSDESFRWKNGGKVIQLPILLYIYFSFCKDFFQMHRYLFLNSCTIQVQDIFKYKSGK